MLVAVYGTLKKGRGNSSLLSASAFMGMQMLEGFVMYSAGGFPVIYRQEGNFIFIEVYEVDEATLTGSLDRLEGHPTWYRRELVDTVFGDAWIYIMLDTRYQRDDNLIETGEF